MTIFDKLSGFAHKAKENAAARVILAKDKRLEKSLSESLDPAHVGLLKMASYGLPSTISCIAFDPVASLLAVAGGSEPNAYIRIFGRGISANLSLQSPTAVKYMQFKIGSPILMTVDRKNIITTYDLRTRKPRKIVSTPSIITCLEHCTGTDWVFVGYADGNIDVFDIDLGVFASYGIPDLVLDEIQNNPKTPVLSAEEGGGSLVTAIQMHPTDLNTVLIGYPSAVFQWAVREQTVKRIFTLDRTKYRGRLTCFAWSPCGNRFMAGYDDGYMHLWDIRSEQKPVLSRKVFQACPTTSLGEEHGEPIYRLVWYFDDAARKSFLAVAGGATLPDIHGLHILEFALDGDVRDARKQTILPTPVDVSDFILLSSEPYHSGMRNPLGVVVVGSDGALRAYGIDHGYPELELPPALQFLDPPLRNGYHRTNIPVYTFQRMTAPVNNSTPPRFLPLTGGVAGSGHTYRLPSNDILITVHEHDIIRFWDASYTSLRPLPHLTIFCREQLKSANVHIYHVAMDESSGSIAVAFDDGSIHLYTLQLAFEDSQNNEALASGCSDTLNELSELLEDMQSPTECDNVVEDDNDNSTVPDEYRKSPEEATNDTREDATCQPPSAETIEQQAPESVPDIHVNFVNHSSPCGYALKLEINVNSPSRLIQLQYVADELLAFANVDGKVYIVNTTTGRVIFSMNAQRLREEPATADKDVSSDGKQDDKKPVAAISCLSVCQTYSSENYSNPSAQVLIGFTDGQVYQVPMFSPRALEDYVLLPTATTSDIVDIAAINLKGQVQHILEIGNGEPQIRQSENQEAKESPANSEQDQQAQPRKSQDSTATKGDDSASTKSEKSAASLLRKTTRKFSRSTKGRNSKDNEPMPMPIPTQIVDEPGEISQMKRNAGYKWDYQQQADPHLLIVVSKKSISTTLMGYNVRLFHIDLQNIEGETENDEIVRAKIMQVEDSTCLTIVLQNGQLIAMSLPHLQPIARIELPQHVPLNKLSMSNDGRILLMTGGLQLAQCIMLLQNSMPCGESVILHNPEKILPPHPSLTNSNWQQRSKKTWLDAVQGAFQKGPVNVSELDTIFGKVTRTLRNEADEQVAARRRAEEASTTKSSGGSEGGSKMGNVFHELGNKMNERGEKLDELQAKFADMNQASGDFLKAVREYNDRQAKKKWWEF